MGSPGAGKTTIGRMLGDQLRKEVVDVDDDVLEKVWGMTVADKVSLFIYLFIFLFICLFIVSFSFPVFIQFFSLANKTNKQSTTKNVKTDKSTHILLTL